MWTAKNRGRYDRSKLRYPSDLTDDEWAHIAGGAVSGLTPIANPNPPNPLVAEVPEADMPRLAIVTSAALLR